MVLQVFIRNKIGKQANDLLKEGLIPAVLYGRGIENINLSVSLSDFNAVYKEAGESAVVKLQIIKDGGATDERNVLISEIQKDPVKNKIIHVDFYQVRMDEKVEVAIPLVFVGESVLVKSGEAILVKVMQEVEVESLPGNLPQELEVDVSALDDMEKNIRVGDLTIPAGVEFKSDKESIIAALAKPEEETTATIEEAVGKVDEVKVEAEEKKKEKEEDGAAE